MHFTKFYLKVMVYDSQVERLYIICDRTYRLKKVIKNKFTHKNIKQVLHVQLKLFLKTSLISVNYCSVLPTTAL